MIIRNEEVTDRAAVLQLVHDAFGQWDESDLITELYRDEDVLFGLVAEDDTGIIGHLLLSSLKISSAHLVLDAAALAPVAVLPNRQKEGIGAELINTAILKCRNLEHISGIIVLGDPNYYQRFGFSSKTASRLDAPFKGEYFMALEFRADIFPKDGKVTYAKAFGL